MSTAKKIDISAPTRRQAIKGIAGAGVVLWSVPTLQVISMTAAHADSPSVVPGTPSVPGVPATPPTTTTTTTHTSTHTHTAAAAAAPSGLLPNTGVSGTTVAAGVAGATAIGLGAAFVRNSLAEADEAGGSGRGHRPAHRA